VILKANLRFTDIVLSDGTIETIIRTLNKTAELINSPSLFQIRRSAFINLNYLHRVDKKKTRCLINVNGKLEEEKISRDVINLFEKSTIYPFIVDD
jgi:two-component system LytT family response regulator